MRRRRDGLVSLLLGYCGLIACSPANGTTSATGGQSGTGGYGGAGGGAPSQGGTPSTDLDAGYDTNATAGCAEWPASRFVPYLGVRFYGPDPGPCSMTLQDGTIMEFAYDASNLPTGATSTDGTKTWTYTYTNGLVTAENDVDTEIGRTLTFGYVYGANTFAYDASYGDSSASNYTATYQLDSRGYPQLATIQSSSSATYPHRYTYSYEECRITTRTGYLDDGSVSRDYSWEYGYDGTGHLVSMTAFDASSSLTFDYACW